MASTPLDYSNTRRRVFETPGYQSVPRYVVKRSVPAAERVGRHAERERDMLRNEVLAIEYVRRHTTIPVPTIVTVFDDRDCIYMVQEYVEGAVNADSLRLSNEARATIRAQLGEIMVQLHTLTDPTFRSFAGAPFLPPRFDNIRLSTELAAYKPAADRYVLCHGDIGWQNVLVDPITFEIKCIIDWEYAGFYPVELEGQGWTRPGGFDFRDTDKVVGVLYDLAATPAPGEGEDDVGSVPSPRCTDALKLTDTQLHIRSPHTGFPPSRPISAASLATQTAIATHRGIADDLERAAAILSDATDVMSDMMSTLTTIGGRERDRDPMFGLQSDQQYVHCLSGRLAPLFRQLAIVYREAADILLPLRERLCDITESGVFTRGLPVTGSLTQADWVEEKVRVDELGEIRKNVDWAYKDMEMIKWKGIQEFAQSLLILSTAVQSVTPSLPDPRVTPPPLSREQDRQRHIAEQRVAQLYAGGYGGWEVSVKDDEQEVARIRDSSGAEWDAARLRERERVAEMLERRKLLEGSDKPKAQAAWAAAMGPFREKMMTEERERA